jgi:hypothetical protein
MLFQGITLICFIGVFLFGIGFGAVLMSLLRVSQAKHIPAQCPLGADSHFHAPVLLLELYGVLWALQKGYGEDVVEAQRLLCAVITRLQEGIRNTPSNARKVTA